jgi:hypothetical protein
MPTAVCYDIISDVSPLSLSAPNSSERCHGQKHRVCGNGTEQKESERKEEIRTVFILCALYGLMVRRGEDDDRN